MKKKIKISNDKIIIGIICLLMIFVSIFLSISLLSNASLATDTLSYSLTSEEDYVYLSDLDYIEGKTAWGSILKDKTSAGAKIQVKIENGAYSFEKGIWAHATSTLVYDLSGYQDYDWFTAYIGLNTTSSQGNGVKFYIYTAGDDKNYTLQTKEGGILFEPGSNSQFIKVNIKGAKYLKLVADDNVGNSNDHAVYADAKLVRGTPVQDTVPTTAFYDNLIKTNYANASLDNKDYELALLQRNLVSNAGNYTLVYLKKNLPETATAFNWLFTDVDNLRMYLMGGKPSGTYIESLKVLAQLYNEYKEDLNDPTYGEVYKKMMITLSLTHSTRVRFWVYDRNESKQVVNDPNSYNVSNAVRRYAVYKKMLLANKLNSVFTTLEVEEMRYVMNSEISDFEIEWLRDYSVYKGSVNPYSFMTYRHDNGYWQAKHYTNLETWEAKYRLTGYGIQTQLYYPHAWMVMEEGGVCWQISNTGQTLVASHGIPSTTLGQPGHVAYANYAVSNGNIIWNLMNDVSGWTGTTFTGYTNIQTYHQKRQMMEWGMGTYASANRGSYILLSQEAINDYDNFTKAEEYVLLAKTYAGNLKKQEEIYREALKTQDVNLDAWIGLINTYKADSTKTDEDYYNLAKEITDALTFAPLPMYDMLRLISPKITSPEYIASFTMLQTKALKRGTVATSQDHVQPNVVIVMAKYLLGIFDNEIAKFSFDGNEAGILRLGSKFDASEARWEYSLDGGNTWTETSEHRVQLTEEQINSITADNDILVHIIGIPRTEENTYVIDITNATINASSYYRNDLENRIIGVNLNNHEWRNSENDAWTSYAVASPDNTGDKTLQIRQKATGTKLPSNVLTFNFTEDNQPNTRKYIPISRLSVAGFSTQATANQGHATNIIDGNYNTRWHSDYSGNDNEQYIIIKFDTPVLLSALEYYPNGGGNGKILSGIISGSMDGENFSVIANIENWANNENVKTIDFTPTKVQYVKIKATNTSGGNFVSGRMLNFFEDITEKLAPTANIDYSITGPTNQNVVARLVNPSSEIEILNNSGSDTYTFTENGTFTFKYRDKNTGIEGSTIAKVDWIDKVAPVGTITFDITGKTNQDVTATLTTNEYVIVTNNGKYITNEEGDLEIDLTNPNANPFTYFFMDNGEFTFEFKDLAGNVGTATAKVNWIDKVFPTATASFDILTTTNKDVTVTIELSEPATILNNDGKNTYTFTENGEFTFDFRDTAGNTNSKTITVDWIDKVAPTAELKYEKFQDKVIVTVINPSEEITFDEGIGVYEFTQNGNYEIVFRDVAGNIGKLTAVIDSLKVDKPNDGNNDNNNDNNNNNNQNNNGNNNGNNNNNNNNNQNNNGNNNGSNNSNNNNTSNNNSNNNNNNNGSNNTNTNNNQNNPINKDYKKYTSNKISIEIPVKDIKEELTLKADEFTLDEDLASKFGNASEYYDIYLTNKTSNKVNINASSPMKISIKLDGMKEFIGVYEITENNIIKPVDYIKNGNNIEITTKTTGKYVVSYKEIKPVSPDVTISIPTGTEKKNNNYVWIIASIGAIILGLLIYLFKKNKKDNE